MAGEPNQIDQDESGKDLNRQLDDLVEKLQRDPSDTLATESADVTSSPSEADQSQVNDQLDGQIESMLKDAWGGDQIDGDAERAQHEQDVPEPVATVDQPDPTSELSPPAQTGQPLERQFAVDAIDQTPPAAVSAEEVERIDEKLAAQVDQMVAGDFESVEELLSVEELKSFAETTSPIAPEPTAQEAEGAFKTIESPMEVAFESVEELLTATDEEDSQGFDAKAEDVARELDQRPVAEAATTPAQDLPTQKVGQKPIGPDLARWNVLFLGIWRAVTDFEPRLRQVCTLINMPLLRSSPDTRNVVGYVGLITLFNASVILLIRFAEIAFSSP